MNTCIGIDLGTTRSVIAQVGPSGKPEVIRNSETGDTTTPSMIYFSPEGPLIGERAKERRKAGQRDIVQLFKRNIDNKHFLFSAYGRDYNAIDLSALLLAYLKKQAEHSLHKPVTDAVITVPAYFTDPQRKATIAAGAQAGLRVLKVMSEPTAAALAYSVLAQKEQGRILVLDLGGGTFDISLVEMSPRLMRVLATDGDHQLGGVDWDSRLLEHVARLFEEDLQVKLTPEERERLYDVVELNKNVLSVRQRTTIPVQVGNQSKNYIVTRSQFEELTSDLMENVQMLVDGLLRDIGVSWLEIDGVLPVGGASRMAMIRSYIQRMSGKEPISGYNPDEIVALGAALQATRELETNGSPATIDVIAHSLGMIVESADRSQYTNSIIIPKNSPIPSELVRSFSMLLRRDGKTQLEVFLTQGEDADPRHCIYLGRYLFTNFPALNEPMVRLDIRYQYDKNGTVRIAAIEHTTKRPLTLTVESKPTNVPGRFVGRPSDHIRHEPMTIYLAFDLSGSMEGEPLEKARQAALSFVDRCRSDSISIGLLSFSDHVKVYQEATSDRSLLQHEIEKLSLDRAEGYGNNDDPFDELYRLLEKPWNKRFALLLTDGVWARPELAIERARRCHAANIEVFAVGFGSANKQFLAQIASSAEQGILVEMNQLIDAFSTIAQEIVDTIDAEIEHESEV